MRQSNDIAASIAGSRGRNDNDNDPKKKNNDENEGRGRRRTLEVRGVERRRKERVLKKKRPCGSAPSRFGSATSSGRGISSCPSWSGVPRAKGARTQRRRRSVTV